MNRGSNTQPCCGIECKNEGTEQLQVILLKKKGYFCENCKQVLLNENLIVGATN